MILKHGVEAKNYDDVSDMKLLGWRTWKEDLTDSDSPSQTCVAFSGMSNSMQSNSNGLHASQSHEIDIVLVGKRLFCCLAALQLCIHWFQCMC